LILGNEWSMELNPSCRFGDRIPAMAVANRIFEEHSAFGANSGARRNCAQFQVPSDSDESHNDRVKFQTIAV
jgi:hypothetical protein